MKKFNLRPYQPTDGPHLLELFRDTIRRINSRDYNAEQIRAWASDEIDVAAWCERFNNRFVTIAEAAEERLGFAELEFNGHIDRFYVSAAHQGCGVGRTMLKALVDEARRLDIAQLFTEASITAKPFFEKSGFVVITPQTVVSRGVEFVNYRMERIL